MLASGIKSLIGWSPAIVAIVANSMEGLDVSILEKGAGYVAAIIFYGLWTKGEASKKEAWATVERVRGERDTWRQKYSDALSQCRDCPGNHERLKNKANMSRTKGFESHEGNC